jgi:Tfp pilus assembly protein PilE
MQQPQEGNMVAASRRRLGVYGLIAIVVVLLIIAVVAAYAVYQNTVAPTPERAVKTYLDTLNSGDMIKLYDMTLDTQGQTQAEFAATMNTLFQNRTLNIEGVAIQSLGHKNNASYFQVTGKLSASDGSYRQVPLVLEVVPDGNAWRVSLFLPPPVLTTRP